MPENKKCILVIDDDDNLCQIIKEQFEVLGYQVLIAYEGAEGFKKTVEGKPDCVILDILIPQGEDGISYLRKVRSYCHDDPQEQKRMRKTPVIVLTGTGVSQKKVFEAEGINGFIQKPFDLTNMRTKIEHVLGLR